MNASSLSAVALALFATACSSNEPDTHEDSDGLVQCTAAPACGPDEQQLEEATEGSHEVSMCGQTIHCAAAIVQCTAVPSCAEDEIEVGEGSDGAREVSLCGQSIWCGHEVGVCEAHPSCAEGEHEVAEGTEGARAFSVCEQTVWCAPDAEPGDGEDDPCPACGMG